MIKDKKFWITICILLIGQATIYYLIKYLQFDYHEIHFFLDSKIPFLTRFVYIYNMFYPFVFICYYYMFIKDKDMYMKGIVSGIIGFLICDIVFLCYPTIMNRVAIPDTDVFTKFVLDVTYYFDSPALNCFPSIHCLFCFQVMYIYLFSKKIDKKKKILVSVGSLLIIVSTLFVKQHYIFDIFGALIVCIIANLLSDGFKIREKLSKKVSILK